MCACACVCTCECVCACVCVNVYDNLIVRNGHLETRKKIQHIEILCNMGHQRRAPHRCRFITHGNTHTHYDAHCNTLQCML